MNDLEFKELVKKGIDGVMGQGCLSVNSEGGCLYINNKGHYCVVGHMMPNDEVRKQAESLTIGEISIVGLYHSHIHGELHSLLELRQFISQFSNSQIEILSKLQSGHDFKHETPLDLTYFYDKSIEIYNKL